MKDRTNDIIISGHNLDLTKALKSMVIEKVSKLFEHENHIIRIRVELSTRQAKHAKEHLAKGLVELHGGLIWAQSDGKEKGSTFSFIIPI